MNVSNNRNNIDALCKGVCLVLLLSGPAATETAVDVLSKVMATTTTASSVIATQTGAQVRPQGGRIEHLLKALFPVIHFSALLPVTHTSS